MDRLPWHDAQWARLRSPEGRARVPHALLLRGPAGTGKRRFAQRLARALLCHSPIEEEACGECRSCHLAAGGLHPDLHVIEPLEERKQILIDQIRDLIGRVVLTASGGSRRAVVIAPAEAMNRPAANTLLKTLEEPPGDTVFLLVSDRSGLLPATIRSRCQALAFPCPRTSQAIAWLDEQAGSEATAAELLALAHGAPLHAVAIEERRALRGSLSDDLESLMRGAANPVSVAERWAGHGLDETSWWLTGLVQDAIRLRAAPGRGGSDTDKLRSLAARASLAGWFRLLDACLAIRSALSRQFNLNERLALEDLALACGRSACDDPSTP